MKRRFRALAGRTFTRFPSGVRRRLKRTLRPARLGVFRRVRPVSLQGGRDRGTPIDRWYLREFFERQADDIRGKVLEVGVASASLERVGHITALDIVDIDPTNQEATLIADIAEPGSLPPATFDCVIASQVLQQVDDLTAAVANLWQSVAPGGVLLLSVPSLGPLDPDAPLADRWRLLPAGLSLLLDRACPGASRQISSSGNVLGAIATLMGLAAEELDAARLAAHDPDLPVLVCARVERAAQ